MMAYYMNEITEGKMKGKPRRKDYRCYMIWQKMMATPHSSEQLKEVR